MNKLFYPKLAGMNIWKNRRIYIPYILTCICNVAMFYMMYYMYDNPDLMTVPGGDLLKVILVLGVIVIGIFSMIFLCYSNSFLVKQRKKEFGLYNVLGMEKRHIRRTMRWEMLYVVLISYGAGFLVGILGSKLLFLLLLKLLHVPAMFGFMISTHAILATGVWFLVVFAIMLLMNMGQIHLANPIELLHGGNAGEKEPKAKLLLVLIGAICLGFGYYIAVTTVNPMDAMILFFVAVILVMIGTYCLFTAGSIAVLKVMKRNKKFYYQTRHFTSVSGMMYRMKQNAVGLANICILSTGVLLMISGTVSMYAGMEDCINQRFPREVSYRISGEKQKQAAEKAETLSQSFADEKGLSLQNKTSYNSLQFTIFRERESLNFHFPKGIENLELTDEIFCVFDMMTLDDFNRLMDENKTLENDTDVLLYQVKTYLDDTELIFEGKPYQVKENITEVPYKGELDAYIADGYYMIVKDMNVLEEFQQMQQAAFGENSTLISTYVDFDLDGSEEEIKAYEEEMKEKVSAMLETDFSQGGVSVRMDNRTLEYQQFYAMYGGLFFLGIFLGLLFLMGTTLIIYYKQVSEGYDDRERFIIMQKVGMSKREVRQSIRSQVLMVFFLPLLMAGVHTAFAFPLMTRLLALLGMTSVTRFAVCTLLTMGVFALVYAAIYALTARTYYKIVNN